MTRPRVGLLWTSVALVVAAVLLYVIAWIAGRDLLWLIGVLGGSAALATAGNTAWWGWWARGGAQFSAGAVGATMAVIGLSVASVIVVTVLVGVNVLAWYAIR